MTLSLPRGGKSLLLTWVLSQLVCAQNTPPLQVTSAIQTTYSAQPQGKGNAPTLGFEQDTGEPRLTEATLSVTGDWEHVGFRIDGGYGDLYRLAMAGDSWKGPNEYISQAYVYAKPFISLPIRIDAGKFFSSVGAESPNSYLDFNQTRSLLFWYGSPLYHVGVKASAPAAHGFTVGAQLLNGVNTIAGAHGHQTTALTVAWAGKRWDWSQLYMGGNEKPEGRGWRHLSDTIVNFHPAGRLTAYVEGLAVAERRTGGGFDRWYGGAAALQFAPRKKWSFSPRAEWYNDPSGATTGLPQHLSEVTLTASFRASKWLLSRVEYRREWSDQPFFTQASAPNGKQTQEFVGGLTFLLSRGL